MTVSNSFAAHGCFKTLDAEARAALDRACLWFEAPAGVWIVDESADDRDVYFVFSGRLRALRHETHGELIFTDMTAGSFFGEMSAFDGAPRSLSVIAINTSRLAKMPAATFRELLFSHRPLAEAVIATLIARVRATTTRIGELAGLGVRARLQAELLRLSRPDPADPRRAVIFAPPSQSEIAARVNSRRETVSRELSAMERLGLIERRRGAITLVHCLKAAEALTPIARD